ncbi:STN domain-containing protein [Variovorax sp. W2I14]|uniref:STN domain-containing protein n=1 Tax=Variovorax sp. W2I14 TaxID=3042290 RepID=UPI003D1B3242
MRSYIARLSRRVVALGMLCGLAGAAWAMDAAKAPTGGAPSRSSSVTTGRQFDFDIPAQPLDAALFKYGDVSRQPALFDTNMIVGRTSSAVRGRYAPEVALHQLLEGTGLTAEKLQSEHGETFVLKDAGKVSPVAQATLPRLFNEGGYPGLIQARIWQALCADPRIAPGAYSSLFRFQVDPTGRIRSPLLLGTTGDAHRDALLLATLRRVQIDRSPPPAVAQQPLTMMLLPFDRSEQRCGQEQGVS